jgi:hypothetical protein
MELVVKRTIILLMLIAAMLVAGLATTSAGSALGLGGGVAYAGEDNGDCGDDDTCNGGSGGGSDTGGTPAGGVETGGGGTAGSDAPMWPFALGGIGALAGGALLIRRRIARAA